MCFNFSFLLLFFLVFFTSFHPFFPLVLRFSDFLTSVLPRFYFNPLSLCPYVVFLLSFPCPADLNLANLVTDYITIFPHYVFLVFVQSSAPLI